MAYLRYQSQTFRNASDRVRRLFFASNTRNDHNSQSFDVTLSVNVGCNIRDLTKYVEVMTRATNEGGQCIITAPDNFATVFTDGSLTDIQKEERLKCIDEKLRAINPNDPKAAEQVKAAFNGQGFIYRATVALIDNQYQVIMTDDQLAALEPGAEIFRKLPGMVVPNYYHSADEYVMALEKCLSDNVKIKSHTGCFNDHKEQAKYNAENPDSLLGKE
ncbi:hypothetical protein [Endozoicomonas atrinae]|uniref:hypothetical protein n=1 Tax=Endozoicomonas atrinae TaxID=1333660 RepID=UPI003AFFCDF3